jgi:hypothetical protein
MFYTPILYIIYNRPDLVELTFGQIAKIKPKELFIAADGPKHEKVSDAENCILARNIVLSKINWDCNIHTLFREENLGCKYGPSKAIDWFFDNVEHGIILEDDILVNQGFFNYCETMLKTYKTDERIMMISGLNISGKSKTTEDYFFGYFGGVWGWATWKRCWQGFNVDFNYWNDILIKEHITLFFPREVRHERISLYDRIFGGDNTVWDTQWAFYRYINSGLCIIPSNNLIKNIGFDERATHTTTKSQPWSNLEIYDIPNNIQLNPYVLRNLKYDLTHLGLSSDDDSNILLKCLRELKTNFIQKFRK